MSNRLDKYFVCMFAGELDFYYEKVKGKQWYSLPKAKRMELRRKAIRNGYDPSKNVKEV